MPPSIYDPSKTGAFFSADPVGFIASYYGQSHGQQENPSNGHTFGYDDLMQCPICLEPTLRAWEPSMPRDGDIVVLNCENECYQSVIKAAIALEFESLLPYNSARTANVCEQLAGVGWKQRGLVRAASVKAAEPAEAAAWSETGSAIEGDRKRGIEMLTAGADYAVEGMLPSSGIAILTGEGVVGKSFIVTSLLMHWGAGESFFDRGIGTGAALYLDYEGSERRWRLALEAGYRQYPGIEGRDKFRYVNGSLPRLGGSVNVLLENLQHNFPKGSSDLGLVVVDSLTAAYGYDVGVDENSASSVETVMMQLREIVEHYHCCVLLIAHPGKTAHIEAVEEMRAGEFPVGATRGTVRGSTRLWDAADMVLFAARSEVEATDGAPPAVLLAAVKDRNGFLGSILELPLAKHVLPIADKNGKQLSSLAVADVRKYVPRTLAEPSTVAVQWPAVLDATAGYLATCGAPAERPEICRHLETCSGLGIGSEINNRRWWTRCKVDQKLEADTEQRFVVFRRRSQATLYSLSESRGAS